LEICFYFFLNYLKLNEQNFLIITKPQEEDEEEEEEKKKVHKYYIFKELKVKYEE
jgi:hypothetical protein